MQLKHKLLALGGLALPVVSFAQSTGTSSSGTDYSSILSGLDTSTAVAAIIGAGTLLAAVGFAKWATKKVGRFFG